MPIEWYRNWSEVAWNGYVDLELYTRRKMLIIDYKSEHFTTEREESVFWQTSMYAYAEFLRYPDLQKIQTGCAYLKDGSIVMAEAIERDELPEIEARLKGFYQEYLAAVASGSREPRQSRYCSWCGYTSLCPLNN
jgi:hypothetical protein